jgi:anti-sigma factor RsiW
MTCRELYGFLDDFLDGVLDPPVKQDFERHIELCLPCWKYLATYRATLRAARGSELADDAPAAAPESLIQAILASRTAASLSPEAE